MKQGRREKILELIGGRDVATQEELLELLRENGYSVTQATVSRDIKQLRLNKTRTPDGRYIYEASSAENGELATKFDILLAESAIKIEAVSNQIVIKCYSGLANAVCAALDTMPFKGLAGTLAGDDTILVIMRTKEDAARLCRILTEKLHR